MSKCGTLDQFSASQVDCSAGNVCTSFPALGCESEEVCFDVFEIEDCSPATRIGIGTCTDEGR